MEIQTPEYKGPERRRFPPEHCVCHLKHEAVLKNHTSSIKGLEGDMKNKVNWKLFALAVVVIVGSSGFLYKELNAHNESLSAMDKRLERVATRQEIGEINLTRQLNQIEMSLRDLHDAMDEHIDDWRQTNGSHKKKGS